MNGAGTHLPNPTKGAMTMTKQNRTKRIATRKVEGGYRVTGQRKTYGTFAAAFQAAWRRCAETGADLGGLSL